MLKPEIKKNIIEKLILEEKKSGLSAARFATKIGINQAQWSRLKKGETTGVLADNKFLLLARQNDISTEDSIEWKTAITPTYEYLTQLFDICRVQSISIIVVDMADIGKTHTAKLFSKQNSNSVYVDCSQVKTKQLFIREVAQKFGIRHTGTYSDVYLNLITYLNTLESPLVIIDEAGDLSYEAFLELKALWNATEGNVGWVMIGADGLKAKMTKAIHNQKVGYTEIFRRYGGQYRAITPQGRQEADNFKKQQAALVAKANLSTKADIQKILKSECYSLTNLYNRIKVLKLNCN